LVEATTEGALLVLDGRCRYANPTLLQMLEYSAHQLELMDLSDVLPRHEANATAWARIERLSGERSESPERPNSPAPLEPGGPEGFEGILRRADGHRVGWVMA